MNQVKQTLQPLEKKSLSEKLYLVRFKTDTESHLKVDPEKCKPCKDRDCIYICPADVYKLDERENIVISYEACLQSCMCRIQDRLHMRLQYSPSHPVYRLLQGKCRYSLYPYMAYTSPGQPSGGFPCQDKDCIY